MGYLFFKWFCWKPYRRFFVFVTFLFLLIPFRGALASDGIDTRTQGGADESEYKRLPPELEDAVGEPTVESFVSPYKITLFNPEEGESGFNQWNSFVYSALMSTFYWEYGMEALAEVPSIQDLVITPVGGWLDGEWAHNKEKEIIAAGGKVWGSETTGSIALFFLDPVDRIGVWVNRICKRRVVKTGYWSFSNMASPPDEEGVVNETWQLNISFVF
jgi:hypothetical protein